MVFLKDSQARNFTFTMKVKDIRRVERPYCFKSEQYYIFVHSNSPTFFVEKICKSGHQIMLAVRYI